MKPEITVIMSVFREPKLWLQQAIESILSQTYTNFEFIIVLDDPQNEEAKSVLEAYAKKDQRILLLINEKNQGLIFSLNRALQRAKGHYIARMDADDISHTDRLEKQKQYIEDKNLDLIGSNINLFREDGNVFATTDKLIYHESIKKLLCLGTTNIAHPTFFVKKTVYDKLGGYGDAEHVEDKEFLARAICEGFRVGNIPETLLDYRYNDQSITKVHAWFVRENGKIVTKHFCQCQKGTPKTMLPIVPVKAPSGMLIKAFQRRQRMVAEIKQAYAKKEYTLVIKKLFILVLLNPQEMFNSVKINSTYRWLRYKEKYFR